MITKIEDYFDKGCGRCDKFDTPTCASQIWGSGLARLRQICRSMDLDETLKWGHPCYRHAGRNIAIIGAFPSNFRLSFFEAALMKDPHGALERQGPNSQHRDMLRFTENEHVAYMEAIIRSYLDEAMKYAAKGLKAPKDTTEPDLPKELVDALAADPEMAEAFDNLTRGRRKSYVLNLNAAKQSETRMRRIAGFRDKIIAGKGALDQ